MRNRSVLTFLSLALVVGTGHAQWTGPGSIGDFNIHTDSQGDAVRITHDQMKNPAGCSNAGFLELRASASAFDEMYSLLLAAKTADRKVDIYLSDAACTAAGHPQITQVSYSQVAGSGLADSIPTATSSLDGLMSAQDKAKLDSLPDGPLATGSLVAVLSGTISDGGTIPLPAGYSDAQCNWRIIPKNVPFGQTCSPGLKFSLNGRKVSAKIYEDRFGDCEAFGTTVDYLNICVK